MRTLARPFVRWTRPTIASATLVVALAAVGQLSQAATITVNTNSATSVAGQCALIDAVQAANTNAAVNGCVAGVAGADTIVFTSNVNVINFQTPLPGTIDALRIYEALTIDGSGGTYNGGSAVRIQRDPASVSNFRLFNAFKFRNGP